MWRFLLLSCMFMLTFLENGQAMTVEEKIREDPDLSEFYSLLERNHVANNTLMYRQLTLFAPTNQAFQRHKLPVDDSWVLYHLTNLPVTLEQLSNSVSSELEGNPPLWVTRHKNAHGHEDIYINNAKILQHKSNFVSSNAMKKKQVLHVIDDVLIPVSASQTSNDPIYNPDAFQFLTRSEDFDIGPHRVRSFRQRVTQIKKPEVFKSDGRFTFFIPVDEGFKPQPRPELIDAKVVDGHIIPNKVLFTKPTSDNEQFETMAFGDNLKVTVSFTKTHDGQEVLINVKSNTLVGDPKHATGVVMADIVKANIPVRNGVVHLIQRPLMVVDTSVTQFLEDKKDGPLFKFYEVIMDVGGEFFQTLNRMSDLTLFAPSNEAWADSNLNNLIRNKEKLQEILKLHLVREKLPMDKIVHNNLHQIFQVPTVADRKSLYFNVVHHGNNQTLTVEGGGVNATVVQPNVAATNGIVHIINRVLGVPYTTVLEKLTTDPMLNDTFFLGTRRGFNSRLNNTSQRFTYFVPRDKAWKDFQTQYPSAHKKMFMQDFSYHTEQILERHLVIADRAYTMADIKMLANDTQGYLLPTIRDILRLRVKESDKSYEVEWENQWIHVFRPDVECTNGIIHVIDYPFLTESDIHVTGGTANLVATLIPNIMMVLIVKWLLH